VHRHHVSDLKATKIDRMKRPLLSYKRPLAIAIEWKVGYRFSINDCYQFQYQHDACRDVSIFTGGKAIYYTLQRLV
jgi:hypothetical protein